MNIGNNMDNLTINYVSTGEVKPMHDIKVNEAMRKFRMTVGQEIPESGKHDDIEMIIKKDIRGLYVFNVDSFKNNENVYSNSLKVTYIPDDEEFKISMNLTRGTKQDILDYLGNEKNADEIAQFMKNLKDKADNKS